MHIDGQEDPALTAEVDRLLARRRRDIRLKGEIKRLFRARVWSQTAKIIRARMIWVALLDVLTLALNMLILPRPIALSMLLPGTIIPPIAATTVFVWRRPRPPWIQGASLIASMFFILLSVALVGVSAGGEFYERHLNIMLFVAITAIIIFGIPLAWTAIIAALALGLYLVFQLQNPVAMLMCDIDHFKKLNDHLGHAQGDRCLVEVARIIQENVRRDRDHLARYGGEEFLVLLPETSEQEAVSVAERIRKSVEAAAFTNPGSRVSQRHPQHWGFGSVG